MRIRKTVSTRKKSPQHGQRKICLFQATSNKCRVCLRIWRLTNTLEALWPFSPGVNRPIRGQIAEKIRNATLQFKKNYFYNNSNNISKIVVRFINSWQSNEFIWIYFEKNLHVCVLLYTTNKKKSKLKYYLICTARSKKESIK